MFIVWCQDDCPICERRWAEVTKHVPPDEVYRVSWRGACPAGCTAFTLR